MSSLLATHLTTAVLNRLPMWSKVDVETDAHNEVVLLASIPAMTEDGLKLVPAFRLEMTEGGAQVFFVGKWGQMDEVFQPHYSRMEALKTTLEGFWFESTAMLWATLQH